MENKKRKKILNIAMVILIIMIAAAGIAAVGHIKGWFAGDEEKNAVITEITGIVNVQRNGISFELKEGDNVKKGDIISTNDQAGAVIESGNNSYEIAENTSFEIKNDKQFEFEITCGEVFIVLNEKETFGNIIASDVCISAEESVFSVNVQTGSMGMNVFDGEINVLYNENETVAKAGETVSVTGGDVEVIKMKVSSLNEFNIDRAIEVSKNRKLCFSSEELKKVLEDREAESHGAAANDDDYDGDEKDSSSSSNPSKNNESGSIKNEENLGNTSTKYDYSCTIEIRCDTILNNMADLKPGKSGYVPTNGIILRRTSVGFNSGETVFDVLNRVCKEKGIQIEYSYSPMYGSSYIEGMNHLYEMDCGEQSGWMYKVNGWFPNYGCSSYTLSDGDSIVWAYTCKGLGEDLGASMS